MKNRGEQSFTLVTSNRLEKLAHELGCRLFSTGAPFDKRLVIVPHLKLKPYLLQHFAMDPDLNIGAGIEILTPAQAIAHLHLPSVVELALEIEEQLLQILESERESAVWKPVLTYLGKSRQHLVSFCLKLSRLFIRYGLYGGEFLKEWDKKGGSQHAWQQALWSRLFFPGSRFTYPYRALSDSSFAPLPHLHLFHFNLLPELYLHFFKRMGSTCYLLSPSPYFLGDLCTDRERAHLHKKIQKEEQKTELDHYLLGQNAFLANMGKLGRDFLQILDKLDPETDELYVEEGEKASLLSKLREQFFGLSSEPIAELDASVQLHAAPSKLREVEVMLDNLYKLIEKEKILPSEIRVLAPDISDYFPFIRMLFDQESCPLAYAIEDLPLTCVSSLILAFLDLIAVTENRFRVAAFLKLLTHPIFLEKFAITDQELALFKSWIENTHIRFGVDSEQKKRFLNSSEEEGRGTWKQGFDQLIQSLSKLSFLPLEFSQTETLGKLIDLVSSLKEDLEPITLHLKLSPHDWLVYIRCLMESYFSIRDEDKNLLEGISELARSCKHLTQLIPFSDMLHYVQEHLFSKKGVKLNSSLLHAVRFSSLTEGSAQEARVIYLLGMQEGAFPRKERYDSLCLLRAEKRRDYLPKKREEDRLLFLQQILLAKEYLIISYQNLSLQDGKEENPSIVVQELLSYCGLTPVVHRAKKPSLLARSSDAQPISDQLARSDSHLINIRDLKQLSRHPIEFFFKQTLGVSFPLENAFDEFLLSPLNRSRLRKEALNTPVQELLQSLDSKGELPVGIFKEIASLKIEEEVEEMQEALSFWSIAPEKIVSFRLEEGCQEPFVTKTKERVVPPLLVPLPDGRSTLIVGELRDATPQGMLVYGEDGVDETLKIWPLFLIYLLVEKSHPSELLFLKTKQKVRVDIKDPLALLGAYLAYAEKAKALPSPLMPEWAEAIFEGKELDTKKILRSKRKRDPYLSLFLEWKEPQFALDSLVREWQNSLQETFKPLLEGYAKL